MRPDNLNTKSGRSTDTDTELKRTEHAKEAKNFQKSLRKPPKGIYLNYEELIHLAKFDYNITFDMLDKKLISLKKEVIANVYYARIFELTFRKILIGKIFKVQTNKQQIGSIIDELTKNYDASAVEENLEFMNLGLAMNETPVWNEHEISMVLQGFSKYGTDFEAISQVMGTKSENSIKSFYLYHKDNYSLEKLVLNPVDFFLII
jgi:REST corepressor 1